jgi:hypothetical protein
MTDYESIRSVDIGIRRSLDRLDADFKHAARFGSPGPEIQNTFIEQMLALYIARVRNDARMLPPHKRADIAELMRDAIDAIEKEKCDGQT